MRAIALLSDPCLHRADAPVVARHPDCLYVVLGATHPHNKAQQGEVYRHSLQALASELGVADMVAEIERLCPGDAVGYAPCPVVPASNVATAWWTAPAA